MVRKPGVEEKGAHLGDSPSVRAPAEMILDALTDGPSMKILASTIERGKAVEEISAEQQLPLSTCYRRVSELVSRNLMVVERRVVTEGGKKYSLYRSALGGIDISLKEGGVSVEIAFNPDAVEKLRLRNVRESATEIAPI